jgi:T5orf172 domain
MYSLITQIDNPDIVDTVFKFIRKNPKNMEQLHYYTQFDDWYAKLLTKIPSHIQKKSGYVYICHNTREPEYYKVGKTQVLPEQRMKSLNNESVIGEILLKDCYHVFDCSQYESAVHIELSKHFPKTKEHFKGSYEDIKHIVETTIRNHSKKYIQLSRDCESLAVLLQQFYE